MHILLITRNLPPLIGGMERLNQEAAVALNEKYELSVIGPVGCSNFLPKDVNVYEVRPEVGVFVIKALAKALRLSIKHKIDCVVGGSGLVAPHVVAVQFMAKSPGIIFVHGLDLIVNNKIYQLLFVSCIRRVKKIIANSQNTAYLTFQKSIPQERVAIIHPGSDEAVLNKEEAKQWLREILGNEKKKVLLFVGRIVRRKGLAEFIDKSLSNIVKINPHIILLIVGDEAVNGIAHSSVEYDRVIEAVKKHNLDRNVVFLGKVDDSTLAKCYVAADCLVFPLVETPGDVEGFGIVAVEAAAHGTPTIAFNEGGVSDAINDGYSGFLIPSGQYDEFSKTVLSVLNASGTYEEKCRVHANAFSWKKFQESVVRVVQVVCGQIEA